MLQEKVKLLKDRIVDLEKHRNINTTPSKAVEEDFSIEVKEKGITSFISISSCEFPFRRFNLKGTQREKMVWSFWQK